MVTEMTPLNSTFDVLIYIMGLDKVDEEFKFKPFDPKHECDKTGFVWTQDHAKLKLWAKAPTDLVPGAGSFAS